MPSCPRCGTPVPVDPDLTYCAKCRPQLPYWEFDPVLLAANKGGYEWWDQCLRRVKKSEHSVTF